MNFGDEDIDWEGFLNLIDRHRIHSIAYHNINHYAAELIPAHVRLTLRNRSDQKRRQMLILTTELVRLSKLFAEDDIFLLSFKGPLLSQQLFDDFGRRYSRHLDLLVKPEELDQAEQLLLSNGYTRQHPDFALTPRQRKTALQEFAGSHLFAPQGDTKRNHSERNEESVVAQRAPRQRFLVSAARKRADSE